MGTHHHACKHHSGCNNEGQFFLRDCPVCVKAIQDLRATADKTIKKDLVWAFRLWSDRIQKNKGRPSYVDFWKHPEETSELFALFKKHIGKAGAHLPPTEILTPQPNYNPNVL